MRPDKSSQPDKKGSLYVIPCRFTKYEAQMLLQLKEKLGVSRADVVRIAIRRLAELEHVKAA